MGAFRAIAFTIGEDGLGSLVKLEAAAVTGAGLNKRAATLSMVPSMPVATIVVARWDRDSARAARARSLG